MWNLYRVDDQKGYLELMRKDSLNVLKSNVYEKQYFSATEKVLLKKLRNNSLDAICLILKMKKLKRAILG